MVQVLSIHHFAKQDVVALQGGVGVALAQGNDNVLFIGGPHTIEVRDLKNGSELVTSFPTVDSVYQIVYSKIGNYVCTLEYKAIKPGVHQMYVRIYYNWNSDCSSQPMTARIAGKVTPGTQSEFDAFGMIEIPTKQPAQFVCCCQTTGNLAIASGNRVFIYKFLFKTHDMSKKKFIDFAEVFEINVGFNISELALSENIICALSEAEVHVFQIFTKSALKKHEAEEQLSIETACINSESSSKLDVKINSNSKHGTTLKDQSTLNVGQSDNEMKKVIGSIDMSTFIWTPKLCQPNKKDDKFLLFPSLVGGLHTSSSCKQGISMGPMISNQCRKMDFSVLTEDRNVKEAFDSVTLLHIKIDPQNSSSNDVDLPYSDLNLESFYAVDTRHSLAQDSAHQFWHSSVDGGLRLVGLSVFLTTPYTGSLYHITLAPNPLQSSVVRSGVFPYTSPVNSVALEPCLLHALTLTGLETYTLRSHPCSVESVVKNGTEIIVPHRWDESVCLIGLRPFLNIESIAVTENCLALIAAGDEADECVRTMYSLHLPSIPNLYEEMIRVGSCHRSNSPRTYYNLLLEAHMVLLTSLSRLRLTDSDDEKAKQIKTFEKLLQDSSALLGDYYVKCETELEWKQAVHYYQLSTLLPDAILERLVPDSPGLVHVITSILLKSETLPLSSSQANYVIDTLDRLAPEEVSKLILSSQCFVSYKKDKVLTVLKRELTKTKEPPPTDALALAKILLSKNALDQVADVLSLVPSNQLVEIFSAEPNHLIDMSQPSVYSLSSLSKLLVDKKFDLFLDAVELIIGRSVTLDAFVDAFIETFPIVSFGSDCNSNSLRLRDIIERYFLKYGHTVTEERQTFGKSVTVLVGLYAASLLGAFKSEIDENALNIEKRSMVSELFCARPRFLNHFHPFCSSIPLAPSECRKKKADKDTEGKEDDPKELCVRRLCCVDLLLFQSLLASEFPSVDDRNTVLKLVESNPSLCGSSSLHVLCLTPDRQIDFILERRPSALLEYCKVTCKDLVEWADPLRKLCEKVDSMADNELRKDDLEDVLNGLLSELVTLCPLETLLQTIPVSYHERYRSLIVLRHSTGLSRFLKECFVKYADNIFRQEKIVAQT